MYGQAPPPQFTMLGFLQALAQAETEKQVEGARKRFELHRHFLNDAEQAQAEAAMTRQIESIKKALARAE